MAKYVESQGQDFYKELDSGETSYQSLMKALYDVNPQFKPLPGFNGKRDDPEYYRMQQMIDCDEVYPGIFLGDAATAKNKEYLKRIGVTHVLNSAYGTRFGFVNTDKNYYPTMEYLGLPLADLPSVDISRYFNTAANFIESCLASNGKVFVHCMMGISRSSTCVIAYLMIKHHMLAEDAIRLLRNSRDIHPNEGFLKQLATLDNQLRRHRL